MCETCIHAIKMALNSRFSCNCPRSEFSGKMSVPRITVVNTPKKQTGNALWTMADSAGA